ncbi:polysaccharide pyruvyl transferase family protein [Alkalihalobacterium alkalinitrilicum]|uniref:polysaccharide pyruvyl transferase family protein n=1 Tax=Alkalihalobacterium alkalinitrilicum TaxID=427920 RepID=UPI000995046B|nr:polysaccharide pyruvyl transferase family protein [Alkalihalobacterium alkalinitrilicum]
MERNLEQYLIQKKEIEYSKKKLKRLIDNATDITLMKSGGNIGDHLIWEATRDLLSNKNYKEIDWRRIKKTSGETAIIAGGGNWCHAYHLWPELLPFVEERFEHVIIFPSSFDTSLTLVKDALMKTKALVFAREVESFKQIKNLCDADLAYDCAFFYNFSTYSETRNGNLNAFRTDHDSINKRIPKDNIDISIKCKNLHEWLKMISRHEIIHTDRAHVMIAAAMMGKKVYCRDNNYHKVRGIANYSLKGFPVYFL